MWYLSYRRPLRFLELGGKTDQPLSAEHKRRIVHGTPAPVPMDAHFMVDALLEPYGAVPDYGAHENREAAKIQDAPKYE